MPIVANIPRLAARNWNTSLRNKTIWISIEEPGKENSKVINEHLDAIPNLKIAFWDVTNPITLLNGETVYPPSSHDAAKILDFILAHPDHDVIVNCAAGVSRSGAVAEFCHRCLGYEWPPFYRNAAFPNIILVNKLSRMYNETNEN